MKRALVVDDEAMTVEAIRSALDWESLGCEPPLSASSAGEARSIMEAGHVDLLLCDIEMPGGDGLSLVAWAKESSPSTEALILTCHAEFSYARRAVQLGSLDYLLKPLRYEELEAAVSRAVARLDQREAQAGYERYGRFWLRDRAIVAERFWLDVILRAVPPDDAHIAEAADRLDIPVDERSLYALVLARVHLDPGLSPRESRSAEYAARKLALRVMLDEGRLGLILRMDKPVFAALAPLPDGSRPGQPGLGARCEAFAAECEAALGMKAACYLGEPVRARSLADSFDALLAMDRDNAARLSGVLYPLSFRHFDSPLPEPDVGTWAAMLAAGGADALKAAAGDYLDRWGYRLDAEAMARFRQDVLQAVHVALRERGIAARSLVADKAESRDQSDVDPRLWLESLLGRAALAMAASEPATATARAKAFIDARLEDDISRDEVAAFVCLSPDHLTRLFKREMGMPVSDYIAEARFERARRLVEETDMRISDIATGSGYSNFSYFSNLFRQKTGLSPSDYREARRKGER